MALIVLFLLGVGNFAMHKAVLESRHELLGRTPWFIHMLGNGRFGLGVEFLVLLGSMLMVDSGGTGLGLGLCGLFARQCRRGVDDPVESCLRWGTARGARRSSQDAHLALGQRR